MPESGDNFGIYGDYTMAAFAQTAQQGLYFDNFDDMYVWMF